MARVMAHTWISDDRLDDLVGRLRLPGIDRGVLAASLVHRSWAHEHGVESNERLEFLGDAVVGMVVTDELFHLLPDAPEGDLSALKARIVSGQNLAAVARAEGLGEFLALGVGEERAGGRGRESLLADLVEAVLGAMYLDSGFAAAYDLAHRWLAPTIATHVARPELRDAKTRLQEHTAASMGAHPDYEATQAGPAHRPTFRATVSVAGRQLGAGRGGSKKQAETAAAADALAASAQAASERAVPPPPTALSGTRGQGQRHNGTTPPNG